MISIVCTQCKTEFITSKRSDTKYCSDECKLHNKKLRTDRTISYQKNKEVIKAKRRDYYNKVKNTKEYKDKARAAYWAYTKDKLSKDIGYKLKKRLRTRLHSAIRLKSKAGSAVNDLGCSIEEFKVYLESKFKTGMTWDNWSKDGWHLDHIKPLCSFDLTDPKQFKEACHYTNLQPLWAKDHLLKTAQDLL